MNQALLSPLKIETSVDEPFYVLFLYCVFPTEDGGAILQSGTWEFSLQ